MKHLGGDATAASLTHRVRLRSAVLIKLFVAACVLCLAIVLVPTPASANAGTLLFAEYTAWGSNYVGHLRVGGYAKALDAPGYQLAVRVYFEGTYSYLDPDPDFANTWYDGQGWHGFDFTVAAPPLTARKVCVHAQHPFTGAWFSVGCTPVNVDIESYTQPATGINQNSTRQGSTETGTLKPRS